MEGPSCTGCNQIIEEGSVIAFGDSLFHLKCFICAKCADPVDCESNLLLLTNGKPVCESCSYCCNACKQVIRDEAIMTGDEAYHADCFQCVSCKQKIDDLVFTQTSKGIHCTPCHEKRRAEKQKRREDRERRLQQKQQAKELPAIPSDSPQKTTRQTKHTNANRHTSRLFDPQMVADYMQSTVKPRNNPLNDQRRRPSATDPPTPSRSRSNSVDIPPKMSLVADTRLTPSRSEVVNSTKNSPNSPPLSVSSPTHPTSIASSSQNMTKSTSTMTLDLPDIIPSLNLSFFDNESTDLINLTKKLGANISMDLYGQQPKIEPVIIKTTENITRASQFLESSLMTDEDYEGFPQPPPTELGSTCSLVSSSSTDNGALRAELETTHAKLNAMQTSYNKIKDASRKALDEFSRAKEEFAKEVTLRQQQEYTIVQLKHQLHIAYLSKQMTRPELSVITKEEIERVAKIRVELDKTCNELKGYRNVLVLDIESLARQKQAGLEANPTAHLEEEQKALVCEIKSLHNDRDQVREEAKALEMMRDEVLHEMIMLNTKNAELTEMNNDLSRRVTEREREAAAVMAGTSFLYSPSPSLSSELNSPINMQRKSSEASIIRSNIINSPPTAPQPPKIFKLKKKGNMFAKLSGKNTKVDAAFVMYGHQHSNVTTSSTLSLATPPNSSHNTINNSDSYFISSPVKKQSSESTHHGSHTFLPTSFLRPTKCDACGEKMWGLSELRCQGCLYATHARCLSQVPQLCYGGHTTTSLELPEMKLFGVDLAKRARFEERSVPLIIEQCIKAVEKRGMDYEGIYRKSGGAAQMRLIHQSFNEEEEPALDLEDDDAVNDIAAVTSVLKQYFRELPNPLLPYHLYSQFIDAVSTQLTQEKTDKFFELLSQLPKVNYDTLQQLMRHLNSIQQRHSENLMTSKNLAMVFGPTLLRDVEASRDLVDMCYKNAVIEFLILHVHDLLP